MWGGRNRTPRHRPRTLRASPIHCVASTCAASSDSLSASRCRRGPSRPSSRRWGRRGAARRAVRRRRRCRPPWRSPPRCPLRPRTARASAARSSSLRASNSGTATERPSSSTATKMTGQRVVTSRSSPGRRTRAHRGLDVHAAAPGVHELCRDLDEVAGHDRAGEPDVADVGRDAVATRPARGERVGRLVDPLQHATAVDAAVAGVGGRGEEPAASSRARGSRRPRGAS